MQGANDYYCFSTEFVVHKTKKKKKVAQFVFYTLQAYTKMGVCSVFHYRPVLFPLNTKRKESKKSVETQNSHRQTHTQTDRRRYETTDCSSNRVRKVSGIIFLNHTHTYTMQKKKQKRVVKRCDFILKVSRVRPLQVITISRIGEQKKQ